MAVTGDQEELYRRLEQSRRLASGANDLLTQQRLQALIIDLEQQIALGEPRVAGLPE